MSKHPKLEIELVSFGQIVPQLHYSVYFRYWWTIREDYSNKEILLFPIHVGWQTVFTQNNKKFYMHITEGNEYDEKQPGFRYHSGSKFSDIKETSSVAITSLYNQLFSNSNTKFSGPYVLDKYLIQVINVGVKNNSDLMSADTNLNNVWEKVGLFKKFCGTQLFGLENSLTQKKIAAQKIPKCTPTTRCVEITPYSKNQSEIFSQTITKARAYCNTNGPGCEMLQRPIITRVRITSEIEQQFERFFADKNIINISSYKVDLKTGQPLKYLKDYKETLWQKYFELYLTGMKWTTFMARLQDGSYTYRNDLGGLCYTCNQYGYGVFEELEKLIKNKIENQNSQ
ncbi:21483_t:CDS:2, partial [Racocetra persica]